MAKAQTIYDRLGGVFGIAAVVDRFSDALIQSPVVGQLSNNPRLREWHTKSLDRLPGLKFMRTLWVCDVTGGPFKFRATRPGKTRLALEEAHRNLRISPEEFDEVAAELGRTLDHFEVPEDLAAKVLVAFAAHKGEVTEGFSRTGRMDAEEERIRTIMRTDFDRYLREGWDKRLTAILDEKAP